MFDTFAVVDWSGGNDRGPSPKTDAIWAAVARGGAVEPPVYLRNRQVARDWLLALIEGELASGRRLMLGFDFPFGFPAGFAERLVGRSDPLAVWDWLAAHLEDGPKGNTRFDLAGRINGLFPGIGPFWFNGVTREIAGLPHRGRDRTVFGLEEHRLADKSAKGAFSVWQLGGAGAVGSQAITGLAALAGLRARFGDQIKVWPFEALEAPVALVEVWPSLIAGAVKAQQHEGEIKDAAQVRILAGAMARMQSEGTLARALQAPAAACVEEGWIFGLADSAALDAAARPALVPPRLKNDCFAMPQGVTWVPVDAALEKLRAALVPLTEAERMATAEAAGRVLAAPCHARRANPPAANSAVDGYGFAHAATGDGVQRLPLTKGRAAAGQPHAAVVPEGSALRILTGAILPEGVDTVVLEEDCASDGNTLAFDGPIKAFANTRKAGEDLPEGAEALPVGRRLTPPDLALLSAVGVGEVSVHRPLRVGVLSTGDELLSDPGTPALPHQIFDANRPMLLALARSWGCVAVDLGHVRDDPGTLAKALNRGATRADVILTSGGASAGDEDHVSALLRTKGTLSSWRIAMKPGRPLALALWDGVPVFGLPGNPVAAFVCALIFARPALSLMAGAGWVEPLAFTVPAGFSKRKKAGRREYLRARLDPEGRAEVFASEGSGRISGLSWASGLVELPDDAVEITPGTPVRYLPYAGFGLG
jgi:molybdopterin molybdotransferase